MPSAGWLINSWRTRTQVRGAPWRRRISLLFGKPESRPRRHAEFPFGIFVAHKMLRRAKATIEQVGLGADSEA